MRTLAIDCATEACSVALFQGQDLLANEHLVLGRGHAERLVPMIADLPGKGCADRILVSRGPGSFTGVRIGIATARALAYAWQAECLAYPTLSLVAAQIQFDDPAPVTVCMHGGHGEYFLQNFDAEGSAQDEVRSLAPPDAKNACLHELIVGSRAKELAALFDGGSHRAVECLPDARFSLALDSQFLDRDVSPLYGRAPDAKLPA